MDALTRASVIDHAHMAATYRNADITVHTGGAIRVTVEDPVDRYGLAQAILTEPIAHTTSNGVEALSGLSRIADVIVTVYGPTGH